MDKKRQKDEWMEESEKERRKAGRREDGSKGVRKEVGREGERERGREIPHYGDLSDSKVGLLNH